MGEKNTTTTTRKSVWAFQQTRKQWALVRPVTVANAMAGFWQVYPLEASREDAPSGGRPGREKQRREASSGGPGLGRSGWCLLLEAEIRGFFSPSREEKRV